MLLSNRILAADVVDDERVESLDQVKRLGDDLSAATLRIGGGAAEVVSRHADRELLTPHQESVSAR